MYVCVYVSFSLAMSLSFSLSLFLSLSNLVTSLISLFILLLIFYRRYIKLLNIGQRTSIIKFINLTLLHTTVPGTSLCTGCLCLTSYLQTYTSRTLSVLYRSPFNMFLYTLSLPSTYLHSNLLFYNQLQDFFSSKSFFMYIIRLSKAHLTKPRQIKFTDSSLYTQ